MLDTSRLRVCSCGDEWPRCAFGSNGGRYRGHPGQLIPYRQWIRENCPSARDRFLFAGDDGFARTWSTADSLGWVKLTEWKTFGKQVDYKDVMTLRAVAKGRVLTSLFITMDGDVPSMLRHWPDSCPCCGLPPSPVVSSWIRINDEIVTPGELVDRLIAPGP